MSRSEIAFSLDTISPELSLQISVLHCNGGADIRSTPNITASKVNAGVLDCIGIDIHVLLRAGDPQTFLGGIGLDLHPFLLASDHRDVLDSVGLDLCLLLHAGDYHGVLD